MAEPVFAEPAGSLLLVLTLGVHQQDGRIFIEDQAGNGLDQWLRHFSRMTLVVKALPGPPRADSVAIDTLGLGDRLAVILAPAGWTPLSHLRAHRGMHRLLADLIDRHDYLQFAIGGAWGDWGSLGALIAAKQSRKASVWTDRVESEVMRIDARRFRGLKRIVRSSYAMAARHLERRVIRRTTLGLFHGKETFEAYHRFSARPFLVHDIHLKPGRSHACGAARGKDRAQRRGQARDHLCRPRPSRQGRDGVDRDAAPRCRAGCRLPGALAGTGPRSRARARRGRESGPWRPHRLPGAAVRSGRRCSRRCATRISCCSAT